MDHKPKYKIVNDITFRRNDRRKIQVTLGFVMSFQVQYQYMKKIVKLNYIKIKNICSAKDTVKRMKRQVTD